MEFEKVCRALYKYEPVEEGELALEEDALVYIWDSSNPEWWSASLEMGQTAEEVTTGLIPYNYVEELDHIGKAKALYNYQALNPDELSFEENAEFLIYQKEGKDWLMVLYENKFGFIPQSYVEEISEDSGDVGGYTEGEINEEPSFEVQPSSSKPIPIVSNSIPTKNFPKDDMLFWRVAEVDKKKKNKKKVRLGISSNILSIGSEEDKSTPIKQWPIRELAKYGIKNKHILIDITGSNPGSFDFSCSSIKQAEAVAFKIRSCSQASYDDKYTKSSGGWFEKFKKKSSTPKSPPPKRNSNIQSESSRNRNALAVKNASSPLPDLPTEAEDRPQMELIQSAPNSSSLPKNPPKSYPAVKASNLAQTQPKSPQHSSSNVLIGEIAVVLYDFTGIEEDELSVQAEERINVINRTSDSQWWRCRVYYDNGQFKEGLVPSDYVSLISSENEKSKPPSSSQEALTGPHSDRLREWTDVTGSFKVEAEFIKYENGKIHLHKVNGVRIAVPLEKMCAIDVYFVSEVIGEDLSVNLAEVKKIKEESARWKEFFVSAGITTNDAEEYATIFTRERFDRTLIKEVDRSVLKGLGMTEGDSLRVEKAAKSSTISKAPKAKRGVTFSDNPVESDEALALRLQKEENSHLGKDPNSSHLREYQIEQDELLARKLQEENDPTGSWRNFNPKSNQANQKYGLGLGGKSNNRGKQSGVNFDTLFEASVKLEEENKKSQKKKEATLLTANKNGKSGFDDEIWGVPGSRPSPRPVSQPIVPSSSPKALEKSDPWKAFGDQKPKSKPVEKPVFGLGNQSKKDSKSRSAIEENWSTVQANFTKQSASVSNTTASPSQPGSRPQSKTTTVVPPPLSSPAALQQPLIPVPKGTNSGVFIPTRRPPPPAPVTNVFADVKLASTTSGGVTTRSCPAPFTSTASTINIFGNPNQNPSKLGATSSNSTLEVPGGAFESIGAQPPNHSTPLSNKGFSVTSPSHNSFSFQNTGFLPNAPTSGSGIESYLPSNDPTTSVNFQTTSNTLNTDVNHGNLFSVTSKSPSTINPTTNQFEELSLENLGLKPKLSPRQPVLDQFSTQPPRPSSAIGGGFGSESFKNSPPVSFSASNQISSISSFAPSNNDTYTSPSLELLNPLTNLSLNNPVSSSTGSVSSFGPASSLKPVNSGADLSRSPQPSSYQTGYLSGLNGFGGFRDKGNESMSSNYLGQHSFSSLQGNDPQPRSLSVLGTKNPAVSPLQQNIDSSFNHSTSLTSNPNVSFGNMPNNNSYMNNTTQRQTEFSSNVNSNLSGQTRLDVYSSSFSHSPSSLNTYGASNGLNSSMNQMGSLGVGSLNSPNAPGITLNQNTKASAFSGVNPLTNNLSSSFNYTLTSGNLKSDPFPKRPLSSNLQSSTPGLSGINHIVSLQSTNLQRGYSTGSLSPSPLSNTVNNSLLNPNSSSQLGDSNPSVIQGSVLSSISSPGFNQAYSQQNFGSSSLNQTSLQSLGVSNPSQPSQTDYGALGFGQVSQSSYETSGPSQISQTGSGISGYGQPSSFGTLGFSSSSQLGHGFSEIKQTGNGSSNFSQPSPAGYGTSGFSQPSQSGFNPSGLTQSGYGNSNFGQPLHQGFGASSYNSSLSQSKFSSSKYDQSTPQSNYETSNLGQSPLQSGYGTTNYTSFSSSSNITGYNQNSNQQQGYRYN